MNRTKLGLALYTTVMLMTVGTIMMSLTFYTAYFHPTKSVVVKVDEYGEADLEAFIILPIVIASTVLAIIFAHKNNIRNIKEEYT